MASSQSVYRHDPIIQIIQDLQSRAIRGCVLIDMARMSSKKATRSFPTLRLRARATARRRRSPTSRARKADGGGNSDPDPEPKPKPLSRHLSRHERGQAA